MEIRQPAHPDYQPQQGCGSINQPVILQAPQLELVITEALIAHATIAVTVREHQVIKRTATCFRVAIG